MIGGPPIYCKMFRPPTFRATYQPKKFKYLVQLQAICLQRSTSQGNHFIYKVVVTFDGVLQTEVLINIHWIKWPEMSTKGVFWAQGNAFVSS